MASGLFLVVISVLALKAVDCGVYKNEQTCAYTETILCRWNATDSFKCSSDSCENYAADQATCEGNARFNCSFDGTQTMAALKCKTWTCSAYTESSACTANAKGAAGVCKWEVPTSSDVEPYCRIEGCSDYAEDEDTCKAGGGKYKCKWDSSSALFKCTAQACGDYSADIATCLASNGVLSCYYNGSDNQCKDDSILGCIASTFQVDETACLAGNGHINCYWNDSASTKCRDKSCSNLSQNECETSAGYRCKWASNGCRSVSCAAYEEAGEQACLAESHTCEWDGKCKEAAALSMGVPSLGVLLLFLICVLMW